MSVNLIEEMRRLEREHRAAYSKLATERDALLVALKDLKADCAVLRQAYDLSCATSSRLAAKLTETPAQSVAHIEAAVLRRFCEEMEGKALYIGGDAAGGVLWICKKGRERADRIEHGAKQL
jgi:hypothetical protein